MKKTAERILSRIPRRRSRHWRYISPHRRGAGVPLLALLAVAVAAYWYLPRALNTWMRDQAVSYLRSLTGWEVAVEEGKFTVFEDIELRGVTVDVQGPRGRQRLLEADTIVLRHRPWSLFSRRRLEPTEVVCIAPTVTLGYDVEKGRYTGEELFAAARRRRAAGGGFRGALPIISVRDIRLRVIADLRRMAPTEAYLSLTMVPEQRAYRIALEEHRPGAEALRGMWRLDLASGRISLQEGNIPKIAETDVILPAQYARWRRRYNIRGKVVLRGQRASPDEPETFHAELGDVSLKLQPAEGGLELAGVRGALIFDANGVSIDDLTGRIPQAGGATFTMAGRYDGYDANSPFALHVDVTQMTVPDGSGATGWLARLLKFLHRTFQPAGRLKISADFARREDGVLDLKGTAEPQGMSLLCKFFPYPVRDARGVLSFTTQRLTIEKIVGRHGGGEVRATGHVDLRKPKCYDVTVHGKDILLDAELRRALPKGSQDVWDALAPQGTAGARVHARRDGSEARPEIEVVLLLDGKTSVAYRGFPYRIEQLAGQVRIAREQATIDSIEGRRGPTRMTIHGTVGGHDGAAGGTDLKIDARDVPLDADLIAALPEATRKAAASLHATGLAERVQARVRQAKDEPLDLRIEARLRDAAFRPDAFPYAIRRANGVLTIRPDRVVIEGLRGLHGQVPIDVAGQILIARQRPALDLHVRADGVTLDDELRQALPPAMKQLWRRLAPAGQADVDFLLQHRMPDHQPELDYRLILRPRGLQVRYEDFPYTLRGVVGRVVATPGRLELDGLTATHGRARLVVDGELTFRDRADAARLRIHGTDVPIDRELLAAIPASLSPLGRRFQPGGHCDLDLRDFRVTRAVAPASRPASRPAADRPIDWSAAGQIVLRGATVDLGLGHKTASGSLRGTAAQRGGHLALRADVALDSVKVGQQQLTHLRARLNKEPRSQLIRLSDLTAGAYGGQLAGFAEIRLADPLEFGIRLSVNGMKLEELFRARADGPARRDDVKGLLLGNIQLTATAGERPTRQASGTLRISRGRISKLPIVLGLLHVVYLSLPSDSAFTDGEVTYHLRGEKLIFDEIYLRGAALSIVGSGVMDMETEALDLTFLAGPPQKLPRIGSLGELLTGIAREIAQIHVGGTLRKPKTRTVPLRSLDLLLRDMLNPGRRR